MTLPVSMVNSSTGLAGATLIAPTDAKLTVHGFDAADWTDSVISGYKVPPFMPQTTGTIPAFGVSFTITGETQFAVSYYTRGFREEVRVSIDGEWPNSGSTMPFKSTAGSGVATYLVVTLPDAGTHDVTIDLLTHFGGIQVANASNVTAAATGTKVILVSDSLGGAKNKGRGQNVAADPTGDYTNISSYWFWAAKLAGWSDPWNWGIGGAGFYQNGDGGGTGNFAARMPSVVAEAPDIVVFDAHVFNDLSSGKTVAQETSQFNTAMTTLRTGLPSTPIILFLTPDAPALASVGGAALLKPYNDSIRAAAVAYAAYVVDPLDGKVYDTDGSLLGQPSSKWVLGNQSSTYITSDGVHPTEYGAWVLGNYYGNALNLIKTTLGTPTDPAPTGLTVVPGDKQVRITWDPYSGADYYNVYVGSSPARVSYVTSEMVHGLTNNSAVTVRVSAVVGGTETALTTGVTATPTAPEGPAPVASYGPNGTHWPDRTPWWKNAQPTTINVACTWDAIKTAINSLTSEQVEAGAVILVAAGTLPGNGASSGSVPVLDTVGSKSWKKRVLVMPAGARDSVLFSGSMRINKMFNVCLARFDMSTYGITFTGCSYSAIAWCISQNRFTNGLGGQWTEGFDVVEHVIRDIKVGDSDPSLIQSGYPGTAGGTGGNAWMRWTRVIGCYTAPQYVPLDAYDENGNQTAGYGHNDTLQFSGSGVYYGIQITDSAFFGANNSWLQIGGWPASADTYVGPIDYFCQLRNVLGLNAAVGTATRYPLPAGAKALTVPNGVNGLGRDYSSDAFDLISTGHMYQPTLHWRTVSNAKCATSSTPTAQNGTWINDTSLLSLTNAQVDALVPDPDDTYLAQVWDGNTTPGGGGTSTPTTMVKAWDGSSWVDGTARVLESGAWRAAIVRKKANAGDVWVR